MPNAQHPSSPKPDHLSTTPNRFPEPRPHHHAITRTGGFIDRGGVVRSGEDLREYRERKGVCIYCGHTKTHRGILNPKKLTESGKVYKGYCLSCHDENEVRRYFQEVGGREENNETSAAADNGASSLFQSMSPKKLKFAISKSHHEHMNHNNEDVSSEGRNKPSFFRSLSRRIKSSKTSLKGENMQSVPSKRIQTSLNDLAEGDDKKSVSSSLHVVTPPRSVLKEIDTLSASNSIPPFPDIEDTDTQGKETKEAGKDDSSGDTIFVSTSSSSLSLPTSMQSSPPPSPSSSVTKKIDTLTEEDQAIIDVLSEKIDANDFQCATEMLRVNLSSPHVVQFGLSTVRHKISESLNHITQTESPSLSCVVVENEIEKQPIHAQILSQSWIEVISSIVHHYQKHSLIVCEAIQSIWIISSLGKKYKKEVIQNGGVNAIIDALNGFSKCSDVVKCSVGALSSLLCDDDQENRMLVLMCIQEEKYETVMVEILEMCTTTDGDVEGWILRMIYGLFVAFLDFDENVGDFRQLQEEEKDEKDERGKKRKHWRNLTANIVSVMSMHKSNAEVQMWSCRLMWILLENLTVEKTMEESHPPQDSSSLGKIDTTAAAFEALMMNDFLYAITAVTDAMSAHKDDTILHEAACGFFYILTKVSSSVADLSAGIIPLYLPLSSVQIRCITKSIVNSMMNHSSSPILQIYGCRTLSNLCSYTYENSTKDVCVAVDQLGGVNFLLQSMQNNLNNIFLLAESCGSITSLCESAPWIKDSIFDSGGIDAVSNIVRFHVRNIVSDEDQLYFLENVCALLMVLSTNSNCVVAIKSSGIVDDLFSVVKSSDNADNYISEHLLLTVIELISKTGDENNELFTAALSFAIRMMEMPTSEDRLINIIVSIHLIVSSMDCCIDAILSRKVRDQVLNAMCHMPSSAAVQEASCYIISFLRTKMDDDVIPTLRTSDEIVAIRNAMRVHQTHSSLQAAACLAIRNFCAARGNIEDKVVTVLFESINDVVKASVTHPKSPIVQENACGAFWALSTVSDHMALSVASSGAIECIIEAMNEFPGLLSLQDDACSTLVVLVAEEENFEAIGTERGFDAIINCLGQYASNMAISERVCSIVAALSTTNLFEVKLAIIEHEIAVNRIIECMYRYPQNSHIQMAGSEIISLISVDEYIMSDIAGLGGIDRLSTAMQQHLDNSLVQEKACEALKMLIPGVENDILMGNDVGKWIIVSMRRHKENSKVQIQGISALLNLCSKSHSNKDAVARLSGISAIVDSMVNHLGCVLVQETGINAIQSLSDLGANQLTIAEGGAIQAIMNGMKMHQPTKSLQIEGLDTLMKLASMEVSRGLIVDCGGVDTIVEIMCVYKIDENIQQKAFATLTSITDNLQNREARIMSANHLNTVVDIMKRFPASEKLQLSACTFLQNCIDAPLNSDLIRGNAFLPVLVQSAATKFPSIEEQAQYLVSFF